MFNVCQQRCWLGELFLSRLIALRGKKGKAEEDMDGRSYDRFEEG